MRGGRTDKNGCYRGRTCGGGDAGVAWSDGGLGNTGRFSPAAAVENERLGNFWPGRADGPEVEGVSFLFCDGRQRFGESAGAVARGCAWTLDGGPAIHHHRRLIFFPAYQGEIRTKARDHKDWIVTVTRGSHLKRRGRDPNPIEFSCATNLLGPKKRRQKRPR